MNKKVGNKSQELWALRHTAEHVLHTAMQNLYPKLKKAMGPATSEGFYHDFDLDEKISEDDFPKIEKEMKRLIKENLPLIQKNITVAEGKDIFKDNEYKLDWIERITKRGEKISTYKMGAEDLDICSGPHVKSTGKIKAFKLLSIAGAYWRGDEKNKMLTRIYGTAFATQKELRVYLAMLEEAKKRDHKKLGSELGLFIIDQDIGKGLPLLTPKGTVIRNEIIEYERTLEKEFEFEEVWTPHIAKNDLYKKTGHWKHYRDTMYAPFGIDNDTYVLKPMNCPHHYAIYSSRPRSYKDLPVRLSEVGTCYRYEKSGELGGLTRVRALSIDDAHILMRDDQVEKEFGTCIQMVLSMFKAFGLTDYYVRLSLADPTDAVKYIADTKTWQKAGEKLEKIIKDSNLKYEKVKGEASFYGPKIDFMVKDAIGREWQMSTLQLDLFMAKKLDLVYTDRDGQKVNPAILHRGLTGSIERTMGILIEHFAGAFPVWLSPVQVKVLPITEKNMDYANDVFEKLKSEGIRTELDSRNETLQAKIRDAQLEKIPYMLIIGDKEEGVKKVAVRLRTEKKLGQMNLDEFAEKVRQKIDSKALDL
ncbi:threonine--tRNA ligase [Patescibacteria group bacterium]|nr:threonine--tRNA ligase [Patescibacteria group bacterium]